MIGPLKPNPLQLAWFTLTHAQESKGQRVAIHITLSGSVAMHCLMYTQREVILGY